MQVPSKKIKTSRSNQFKKGEEEAKGETPLSNKDASASEYSELDVNKYDDREDETFRMNRALVEWLANADFSSEEVSLRAIAE